MPNTDGVSIQPGDLLRVEEAAQIATVRPSTIRAWLSQGKLPRMKVGRCTRVSRDDLEELIRAGRSAPAGKTEASTEAQRGA
jgi:excisionase family DNA binding protein